MLISSPSASLISCPDSIVFATSSIHCLSTASRSASGLCGQRQSQKPGWGAALARSSPPHNFLDANWCNLRRLVIIACATPRPRPVPVAPSVPTFARPPSSRDKAACFLNSLAIPILTLHHACRAASLHSTSPGRRRLRRHRFAPCNRQSLPNTCRSRSRPEHRFRDRLGHHRSALVSVGDKNHAPVTGKPESANDKFTRVVPQSSESSRPGALQTVADMGICMSSNNEEAEQKKKSQAIDKILEEDSKRLRKECKILLLGA